MQVTPGMEQTSELTERLPLLLFVWITRASGVVSVRETQVFLRMLENSSWCQSRWARENLYRARERLPSTCTADELTRMTRDLELLHQGLRALREALATDELGQARIDLMRLAEATARASGGLLGQGGMRRDRRDALLVFTALAEAVLAPTEGSQRPPSATPGRAGTASANGKSAARKPQRIRCTQVLDEGPDVRTFRFAAVPPTRFSFLPGQFTTLAVPVGQELVRRSYTIASTPSRPDLLEVTVKRVPGGRVSNWLHDNLRVGDELDASGPAGNFSCELGPRAEKLLLVSGGSGITPVMSMSRYLYDTADPRDIVFLYSARTEADLVFREELAFIAARSARFRTVYTLTNAPPTWRGLRGRISRTLIEDAVPDFRERVVYLCGPTPFMEAVREALVTADFPMSKFCAESFGGAPSGRQAPAVDATSSSEALASDAIAQESRAALERLRSSAELLSVLPRPRLGWEEPSSPDATAAEADQPAPEGPAKGVVVFSMSGREAQDCAGETILDAAEAVGVSLPSACRSGVCGTCRTRKLEGNVVMECEDGLDASDRSAGFILACTARALDRVVIEA